MGWASGSSLADDIWRYFRSYIPEALRQKAARRLVDLFEKYDCDTMDECALLMRDANFKNRE
jgi:hypothetical protein